MALRPLLTLPTAVEIVRPAGQNFVPPPMRTPSGKRQRRRLEGEYQRLVNALNSPRGLMSLRDDPASIAPDRAIVFEIAGSVANFYKAAAKVPGLEFIAEEDYDFEADDDFAMLDDENLPDADSPVTGRFYLAMPNDGALNDILRLYREWRRGRKLARGFTPWRDLFACLKIMRPWGPQDRITDDAVAAWREEIAEAGVAEVRVEAELFYRKTTVDRANAMAGLNRAARALGGDVITSAEVPDIAYHAALISLPLAGVQQLVDRRDVELVLADQVMFLRPQSTIRGPVLETEAPVGRPVPARNARSELAPVAALLDGVPLQNHVLLANRLNVDDADGLEPRAVVSARQHGTAMASLIIHGDLNGDGSSIERPLHVHPILFADAAGRVEQTAPDRLLVDTLYRAIVRMKDPDTPGGPTASEVFIVNLSLGDRRRAFAGPMSPLGKLLDFLAHRYNLLFLVSAGNVTTDVALPGYNTLREIEEADPDAVTRAFLGYVRDQQANRTLLSPAECLNPLTIGAAHEDQVAAGFPHNNSVAPYADIGLPNVSSAMGLGHRRVVKPDLLFPGGRERLRMQSNAPLVLRHPDTARGYGLRCAGPDPSNRGDLSRRTLSCGTSPATALASRAAHLIFDSMADIDGGSNLADIDPAFHPVVVKALLAHSARWPDSANLIAEIFGPAGPRQGAERVSNVSRLIGYGMPDIARVMDCSPSQATLVGYGEVTPTIAHEYRVPLPQCLERVVEPRKVVLTLAWFSPVTNAHLDYRRAQLLVDAPAHRQAIGVRRLAGQQPSDHASKRGSLVHEIYGGEDAVVFIDDGNLVLRVWCREKPSSLRLREPIRYGLAVTIEAGLALPVYEQVDVRLRALAARIPSA